MKLHVFQSYSGDALLVESGAGTHRILCDGGTRPAMRDFVAPALAQLVPEGTAIDLLYVSHIDSDHIGGALVLLETALEWAVWDYHAANGNPPAPPALPRLPAVKTVWHNAFRDLITRNAGDIERLLAAAAPVLGTSTDAVLRDLGRDYAAIATSVREALRVSRLLRPDLLDIGLNVLRANPQHSGRLLMARSGMAPERFGTLEVRVLGPTAKELRQLRKGWDHWLRNPSNRAAARAIRDRYALALAAGLEPGRSPFDLGDWEGTPDYKNVTTPNIASLVLLVQEADRRVLLTGDNHPDMILEGLEAAGELGAGHVHLDVLKFPHHGSEHNITDDFTRRVSADHYVFCGDGSHSNPELSVLQRVLDSRVGPASKRVLSPTAAQRPFRFWFSTSSGSPNTAARRRHMRKVEAWARQAAAAHGGRAAFHFNAALHQTIAL